MPTVDCGFPDVPGPERRPLLVDVGPTVPVQIGFDPGFDEFVGFGPDLSPDLFPALVDTGASANCIDADLAVGLRLPVIDNDSEIVGSAGPHFVDIYLAQIHIPGLERTINGRFTGVRLAAGGQLHRAILGREFLRDLVLHYDGLSGEVTISSD